MTLPIDLIILAKDSKIPSLIAQLTYKDKAKAIHYMRIWGEKRMPITPLYDELTVELKKYTD